ncbi:MAG: hypothetical protein LPK46_08335 [Bacteroidota bacterium]|nr:hypothetical protein [Bacteroidota bacterium]MDX5428358.1 hypothetical protein [Bacteroidota bacterium]MDX5447569.1 hypothetical protein [Bacteroidota bacterium]MDX5506131.1 hypothetical protein [Bacteroidota bacterium]
MADYDEEFLRLREDLQEYLETRKKMLALDFIDKSAKLMSEMIASLTIWIFGGVVAFFLVVTVTLWLGYLWNNYLLGVASMTGFLLLLFLILWANRKKWLGKNLHDRLITILVESTLDEDQEP